MKNGPKLYIILPVHNRIDVTAKFVQCLLEQTYQNYHLILVDDGSTDGTGDFVAGLVSQLTVLRGDGNLWWAGSLTKAFEYLSQNQPEDDDVVLIMNDDTTFDANYLEAVVGDTDLGPGALVVSPGLLVSGQDSAAQQPIREWGFAIDWPSLGTRLVREGEEVDAATTRGLYMPYSTYRSLGPLHPRLLPHYLSDLEYTIRAKRRGLELIPSKSSELVVDRSTTGSHRDEATSLGEFLYNHLVSKKTAYNTLYWGNFVLLAAPWRYKFRALVKVYVRFLGKLARFIKRAYINPRRQANGDRVYDSSTDRQ
ncbi:MAG TPA: glycosyltransferase [Anaerolineae bacterium]|nr:glycosyltransferase [Anaerolineae bacterium]